MPWIRKGKCVYKKKPDGSAGKKVGCSKSVAGAKRYLKKLYLEYDKSKKGGG